MDRKSGLYAALAAVGLGGITWSLATQAAAQPTSQPSVRLGPFAPVGPTRVGVVDLVRIFDSRDGCDQLKDVNAMLAEARKQINSEAASRREALDESRIKLEAYRPNSADYRAVKREYLKQASQFDAWLRWKDEEVKSDDFSWMSRLYDRVCEIVRRIAAQKGLELVVTIEPFTPEATQDNLPALQAQIRARKVVYHSPSIDITDAVIDVLNREYHARGGRASLKLR